MFARRTSRLIATAVLVAALTGGALAGCSGEGATSTCSTTGCTITFERNVTNAKISILGVEVQLVSANQDSVTLKVAGQEVTVQRGDGVSVGDFTVKINEITDSQVVVQVDRGGN
ncbi:hypothetical protein [Catellatospora citrea]|uniref:Uncharacterized protein n=1 Tax=Catellatospora citrea TaxID=53366 RepID=A0A8J3KAQ6_9ACTN|nr:hypothetical protein [Catellatospora citrea]RKE09274.1 hypothetical protein C8E86_4158 [Catellatospora citrea]GIF97229.1 hypothetical protein Cci01nite_23230 [Catellatospora citrea]